MKSKSFTANSSATKLDAKLNKTFDFAQYYKTAEETNNILSGNVKEDNNKEDKSSNLGRPKQPNKRNKKSIKNDPVNISQISIDGTCLNGNVLDPKVTSTPNASKKLPKVKSIMKNRSIDTNDVMDITIDNGNISFKSKKRNKSVSFLIDDGEETAVKKTKSNDSIVVSTKKEMKSKTVNHDKVKKKKDKLMKSQQAEKENKSNEDSNMDSELENKTYSNKKSKDEKVKILPETLESSESQTSQEKKKKLKKNNKETKKLKKVKEANETELKENVNNNNEEPTKIKKKKRQPKVALNTDTIEAEGEPLPKTRKTDDKTEIVENLENLKIGDNAHTLTNLLDGMSVADKDKLKKIKRKHKKNKKDKPASVSSSETADLEKIEEGKEKVKWRKRKWNKDKKGEVNEDVLLTSVIVENLPLSIILSYRKTLATHFAKCGLVRRIGVAEVYPTEESKPVFTSTIYFYSEDAAEKALEEDNTAFEGSRIRVKRPLPPTQTTVVIRSYGALSEQSLTSIFTSAGRIRSIRVLLKGRNTISTAFIEFNGPEAVEQALKLSQDAKIGGKKFHVSKFEQRGSQQKANKKTKPESDNDDDSDDSND